MKAAVRIFQIGELKYNIVLGRNRGQFLRDSHEITFDMHNVLRLFGGNI